MNEEEWHAFFARSGHWAGWEITDLANRAFNGIITKGIEADPGTASWMARGRGVIIIAQYPDGLNSILKQLGV